MLTLLLILAQQAAPAPRDIQNLQSQITTGLNTYIQEGRRWSGTLTVSDVTQNKKALRSKVVKGDGQRYLVQHLDANRKPTRVEIFRTFGDIRQLLTLQSTRLSSNLLLTEEVYRKKGEPALPHENNRDFAYDAPIAIAFLPVPDIQYTFLDFLDSPACHVTKIEPLTSGSQKLVKVTYVVNKEENDKLPAEKKLNQVLGGWIEFRPDQMWTIQRSEYKVAGARRSPARTWKADYVYAPVTGDPIEKLPVLKEIRLETIDQSSEKSDLKLVKQVFEFDFKPTPQSLTDRDFSMAQFSLPERTASDWLADLAAQEKAEADLQSKIAALPANAVKIADSGWNIDPWVLLIGGTSAFIVLVLWVLWRTSKRKQPGQAGIA